jgi:hypothetical protein
MKGSAIRGGFICMAVQGLTVRQRTVTEGASKTQVARGLTTRAWQILVLIGWLGAIAPAVIAQTPKSLDGNIDSSINSSIVPDEGGQLAPAFAPIDLLTPAPLSVRRPGETNPSTHSVHNQTQLKEIANSIQAQPQKTGGEGGIPSNLVPKDLIHAPTNRSSDTNPIEFFQVPNPAPSFGINVNTD